MNSTRTPSQTRLVDRSMVAHIIQAVPGDISDEARMAHLREKALSHLLFAELLRTDPKKVNLREFRQALRGEVKEFASADVLKRVRALGGQFATAQMTKVPGGETLEFQKDSVIRFRVSWLFEPEEAERLTVEPSIASQVVYLADLVEDSLGCTYDKVPDGGHKSIEEVISALPEVEGLRWTVGNIPTVNRVFTNHLEITSLDLLPGVYTHTTDTYQDQQYGLRRLVVGYFDSRADVDDMMRSDRSSDEVGLFVLGVPA